MRVVLHINRFSLRVSLDKGKEEIVTNIISCAVRRARAHQTREIVSAI